jgi:hypothetical protein
MSVIPLTIFFSLLLVALFVGLFWREQRARRFGGLERESLLPLAEEKPAIPGEALGRAAPGASAPASVPDADLYF